jgi:hypothetical protein
MATVSGDDEHGRASGRPCAASEIRAGLRRCIQRLTVSNLDEEKGNTEEGARKWRRL